MAITKALFIHQEENSSIESLLYMLLLRKEKSNSSQTGHLLRPHGIRLHVPIIDSNSLYLCRNIKYNSSCVKMEIRYL